MGGLAGAVLSRAEELGVSGHSTPDRPLEVEFTRGERAFAVVEDDGAVSFRLAAAVATAAVRTPDTEPSERGRGWVTLRPSTVDDHALDRARAWFESAWRAAAD